MATVSAPTVYNNSIVIAVPKNPGGIGSSDTPVDLWYVTNTTGQPKSIVDDAGGLISSAAHASATMRVRGMATKSLPKQQYSVKLDAEPATPFLGMPGGGKKWVFNDCGAMDYTLVRNALTFKAQNALGQYAPAHQYFELFLCDSGASPLTAAGLQAILADAYHGLYLNLDKIEFSPSRINLPHGGTVPTTENVILQLNQADPKYYPLPDIALTSGVQVYEPKAADLTADDQNALVEWYAGAQGWGTACVTLYDAAQNIAPAPSAAALQAARTIVAQQTDFQSFAVYFLLNELSKDEDGYHKSTFMVKNGQTCAAGPLWDKNKAYGNAVPFDPAAPTPRQSSVYDDTSGWLATITGQAPVWWSVLMADADFAQAVSTVWTANSGAGGVLTADWLTDFVDQQVQALSQSGALDRDCARWPSAYNSPAANYTAGVDALKTFLTARIAWIGANVYTLVTVASMSGGRAKTVLLDA